MARSVLVIGAGVIGLCTAYSLRERGFDVTVVERSGPDHAGCSLGNAGMVVPSHFIPLAAPGMVGLGLRMLLQPEGPFSVRPWASTELLDWCLRFARSCNAEHVRRSAPVLRDLGLASRAAFLELAERLGDDFGLTTRGLLMLCKRPETLHEETLVANSARALGIEAEVLTPDEAMRLDPTLRLEVAGGVYFPQDCHLDPRRLMAALTGHLQREGVHFLWETPVTGWRRQEGRVTGAETPGGELSADEYVAAGGSWSGELLRGLGVRLRVQAGKGYSITLPDPPKLPELCSILIEARIAVTPMGRELRFAGTMELGGLDLSVDTHRAAGMRRAIPTYMPDIRSEMLEGLPVWSGLRPCTPDGLPYLGRCAPFSNLTVAAGHAMMGVSLGPVTGQIVAEILTGGVPSVDLSPLRPDRG